MSVPNKAVRSPAPFQLSEYPSAFPKLTQDATSNQTGLDRWYYDLRSVLLRERGLLSQQIQAAVNAIASTTDSSIAADISLLQSQVAGLVASVSTILSALTNHVAAHSAHGSNGIVAGLNDLVSVVSANGFLTLSVNASGTNTVIFDENVRTGVVAATFDSGAAPYSWTTYLSGASRKVGDLLHFKMMLPASVNPTIAIKDLASGADLVTFTHSGVAGFYNLIFVYNSDLNFYVHTQGIFEPI